jgi:hypothetical protein
VLILPRSAHPATTTRRSSTKSVSSRATNLRQQNFSVVEASASYDGQERSVKVEERHARMAADSWFHTEGCIVPVRLLPVI